MICLIAVTAFGQTDYKLSFGSGLTYTSVADKGMSPLTYGGFSVSPGFGLERNKAKTYSALSFHVNIGNLTPDINPDLTNANAAYFRTDLDLIHLYFLKNLKENDLPVFIGGAFNNYGSVRVHTAYSNNSFNYEIVSSLSVAGRISKDIKIKKRQAQLQWQLMLPLVAFVQRPGFAFAAPHYYLENDRSAAGAFLKSGNLTTWNDYFRLNSKISFNYFLKNSNAFRLSYEWDFYKYDEIEINRMQLGEHTISIALIFDL